MIYFYLLLKHNTFCGVSMQSISTDAENLSTNDDDASHPEEHEGSEDDKTHNAPGKLMRN